MTDLCILFVHHKSDDVTRHNLETIKRHHPDTPVVAVWCDDGHPADPLPDSVQVRRTSRMSNWYQCDEVLFEWFRSADRVEAERYVFLEWDTMATGDLRHQYADVWDADVVAANAIYPGDPWPWFAQAGGKLPEEWKPYMVGISPMSGLMLSRRALEAMSAVELPDGVYCELRLGTAAHWCGWPITTLPRSAGVMLDFLGNNESRRVGTAPGIYHPVRTLNSKKVVMPYWGEFGWMIARHVRWVDELQASHKVVCCRPGDEVLYPSADEFVLDYPEGIPDAQRCEDGLGPDEVVRSILEARYPGHEVLKGHYPHPWAWDHATHKVPVVARGHLPPVDVALCPRRRDHGVEKNWDHWTEVVDALRSKGFTVGLVGRPETSFDVPADTRAWDHPNGPTSGTVDLLRRCKLYVGGDTGVSHLAALLDVPTVLFAPPHHLHGWTFISYMQRATTAPFDVLGPSAWTNASEVTSAVLVALRGSQVAPVNNVSPAWADGRGERMWAELHSRTDPSPEWLDEFSSKIPCGPCKAHWFDMKKDNPPTFEPLSAWRHWTWSAHQRVNERIGKPGLTYVQAAGRWGWR